MKPALWSILFLLSPFVAGVVATAYLSLQTQAAPHAYYLMMYPLRRNVSAKDFLGPAPFGPYSPKGPFIVGHGYSDLQACNMRIPIERHRHPYAEFRCTPARIDDAVHMPAVSP